MASVDGSATCGGAHSDGGTRMELLRRVSVREGSHIVNFVRSLSTTGDGLDIA